ncbi:extracellular catalytic domain type 1 short-chain-length polyhydroxyalkanoate depolymerase [Sphingomonas bacterium]|uniref:extracellular catalytic domain type 1 short-chain-length polyhydroxyalkanoate depolymerase n=1 Tax=Sphingomonas bacterium TaxID=1895847 RepID=UPI001C2D63C1|nr:PHB depolymerase family esterase [Sphingomonas bacterium]
MPILKTRHWSHAIAGAADMSASRLQPLTGFGSNPGALNGWLYAPDDRTDMALVVVLHGCTQTAAGYNHGSGWSDLAEQHGFAVLFPEQQRTNNPNLCFNWFVAQDVARDSGEVLSIRQMIDAVVGRHAIDPRRIFVTGLSAGGAMAGAMLAVYPELFAGGGIIAGIPYGAAFSVSQAMERMRGAGHQGDLAYADKVRRASSHQGPWPTVSIWQGEADRTVKPANADAIIGQWRGVHGAAVTPDRTDIVDGHRHRVWLGSDGRQVVEEYRIAGMDHGLPLKTQGPGSCGTAGAFMLEAGISSTWRQAQTWGLLGAARSRTARPSATSRAKAAPAATTAAIKLPVIDLKTTIEGVLRSAGLMR